jgi:predicted RNase H-like nuclease (RuvC/YqgF family)
MEVATSTENRIDRLEKRIEELEKECERLRDNDKINDVNIRKLFRNDERVVNELKRMFP